MMTFAQAWERQERLRHRSLLQQLKAEFSAQSMQSMQSMPPVQAGVKVDLPAAPDKSPHPKPRKTGQERRSHIRSVEIR